MSLKEQLALEKLVKKTLADDPEGYLYLPDLVRGLGFEDDPLPIWELLAASAHGGGLELHTVNIKDHTDRPAVNIRNASADRPLIPAPTWVDYDRWPIFVSTATSTKSTRPLRANGSSELREGDRVFQYVRGPFYTEAHIYGIVVERKGQLRVQITGSASMLGAQLKGGGKTHDADESWIWSDDPMITVSRRRRDARTALDTAQRGIEEKLLPRQREEVAASMGLRRMDPSELRTGLVVYGEMYDSPDLVQETVHAVVDGDRGPEFTYLDEDGYERTSGHVAGHYWVKK